MAGFSFEPPAYIFGQKERLSLSGIAPDFDFLEWGERSNAAVIVPSYAEDELLSPEVSGADAASINWDFIQRANSLELTIGLLRHCRERWPDQTLGFLELAHTYLQIASDATTKAMWQKAAALSTEGARLHYEQPQQALELYSEALQEFEKVGDPKGVGKCLGNVGLLYLDHGNFAEAIRLSSRALAIHQQVNYQRGQVIHLFNLATAYEKLQQWENALSILLQRQAIERLVAPTDMFLSEARIANCHHQMGGRKKAEESYHRALLLAHRIQLPSKFGQADELLLPLAEAFHEVAAQKELLTLAKQQSLSALQALDSRPLAGAGPLLQKFQAALAAKDERLLHEAVAQSERWSSALVECLIAQNVHYSLAGDQATAQLADRLAESLGYQLCRSCLVRWPLDEVKLFNAWALDEKIVKAKAYDAKARALTSAWSGELDTAQRLLRESARLHEMIGDRDAVCAWFPEAFRELGMQSADRQAMYGAVFRSDAMAEYGARDGALEQLMNSLAIAREKGSRINVADKYIRIAIFHHRHREIQLAAQWFESAEKAFDELEKIGLSAFDEPGRANNKIKLAVHLGEYLRDVGRHSEAAFVLAPALREADWFIESYADRVSEYLLRIQEYKGRILYCLARSYERLGMFEKSLEYARQMAVWFDQQEDEQGRAAAHNAASSALKSLGRISEALAEALADVELQRRLGVRREIAIALNTAATLYFEMNQLADAERAAKESLHLVENHDSTLSEKSSALHMLGAIAAAHRDWKEAVRLYKEALEIDEALSAEDDVINTMSALAGALLSDGQAAEAAGYAERAWTRSARVQSFGGRYSAGYYFAACKMASDSRKDWYDAVNILLEVCNLAERMRGEAHEEAHKIFHSIEFNDSYNLLIEALVALSMQDVSLRRMVFKAVERAKARALAESIAAAAQQEAEHRGIRLGGILSYATDPREELGRVGYDETMNLLRREAGLA